MRGFAQQLVDDRGVITLRGNRNRAGCERMRRRRHAREFDVLEDRTVLSTLDITSGALTYDATTTASDLTVSSTGPGGTDTFTDTDQLITLTAAAMTAGWSGSWHEHGDRAGELSLIHGDHDQQYGRPEPDPRLHHRRPAARLRPDLRPHRGERTVHQHADPPSRARAVPRSRARPTPRPVPAPARSLTVTRPTPTSRSLSRTSRR